MELLDKKGRTEAEFLASYDKDRYEKPSVAADIVVFSTVRATDKSASYQVLLVRRGRASVPRAVCAAGRFCGTG